MRERLVLLPIAIGLLAAIAGLALLDRPALDYRDGDFFQFRAGARALLEGASPYDKTWWAEFHARESSQALLQPPLTGNVEWTTPYPLWTFLVLLPFGALPLSASGAAWLVAQLAGLALGVIVLARALPALRERRAAMLLASLAVAFQPTWFLVLGGNVTGFVFTAFSLSVAAALGGHNRRAGAALALVMIKPQSFALIVPSLVAALPAHARKQVILGGASIVSVLAATTLVLRPGWIGDWIPSALAMQGTEYSNATGWTLGRIAGGPIVSVFAVCAVVAVFAMWWRVRRPDFAAVIAAATSVSVFASPHGWSHEHLYLLVPAAIVLSRLALLPSAARAAGAAAWVAVLGVLPWMLLLVPRPGEAPSALVPVACFALVVLVEEAARAVPTPVTTPASVRRLTV